MKLAFVTIFLCVNAFAQTAEPPKIEASKKIDAPDKSESEIDEFKITPAMLTINSEDKSKEKAVTTPGLIFEYKKTFGLSEAESYKGFFGSANAIGKIAFDNKQNVGDLIDLHVGGNYRYRYGGAVSADFQREGIGYFIATIKGGIQADQKFETRHDVISTELAGYYAPANVSGFFRHLIPKWTFGYDRVDPEKDFERKMILSTLSSFDRLHARISGSAILGKIMGDKNIKFEYKLDHWREKNSSLAIQSANLDRQTYRAFSLREASEGEDAGWSVTYSSGKVPTDQIAAKVWAIGYTFNVK